jgi:hypothetical protein
MAGDEGDQVETGPRRKLPRWLIYLLILGFYLTLRGYHSFDGDQAYRLPLLLHRQNPQLYADDPFVRAFDEFNPHRGALWTLDVLSRPLGLPAALFVVFVLTFVATCLGIERLARSVWPDAGHAVGFLAVGLVLAAKAGNIGTNHLFEAMVLDRLIAFALGWLALGRMVDDEPRQNLWASAAIGCATLVHPSVGLQLAMLFCTCWAAWSLLGRWTGVRFGTAIWGMIGVVVAVLPGLGVNFAGGALVTRDMPADTFWRLSVELQSPQHMLPHLWRMPQWLAWSSYIVLAGLTCTAGYGAATRGRGFATGGADRSLPCPPARLRLMIALAIILVGLAAAWLFIEVRHDVPATVFQPFRMATTSRGIALVLVAGRLLALWQRGTSLGRMRAILLTVGFIGDWLLVVVALAELAVSIAEATRSRIAGVDSLRFIDGAVWLVMLAVGLNFLGHHDTEYGHFSLLWALGAGLLVEILRHRSQRNPSSRIGRMEWTAPRIAGALALAWFVPLAALLAAAIPWNHPWSRHSVVTTLLNRCRFIQVPVDDVERLALWCKENTPPSARFIGPPGPKTFRLWSQRNLAFNRSGSPYHAAGLADWYARFQDHVDFHVAPAEFVHAYVKERHRFEARYQALSDTKRAALAVRQGAGYVIAAAPMASDRGNEPTQQTDSKTELLHVEGCYAVYRVNVDTLVQRHE